jgi:hypothetical protein
MTMTTQRERLRRPEPKRTEPIRDFPGYLRDSRSLGDIGPEGDRADEPGLIEAADDALARGVQLGYRIIDEHILQGRRKAQELRAGEASAPGDSGKNVEVLVGRAVDLTKDLGALWLDAVQLLVKHAGRGNGSAEPGNAGLAAGLQVGVEIASSRPVMVKLQLPASTGLTVPRVHALHAADPASPPLTGISFRTGGGAGALLHVEVPDHQPAGLYSGVVVDQASNEPLGTLSIRIQA